MSRAGSSSIHSISTAFKCRQMASRRELMEAGPSIALPPHRHPRPRLQSTHTQSNATNRSNDSQYVMPSSQQATPYEIFHLPNNSSSKEIKERYYELVKIFHPDRALARSHNAPSTSKSPSSIVLTPEKANEDFKRVREAYNILGNEGRRRVYDRSGVGWDPANKHGGTGADGQAPVWKGGFPRTEEEMEAYEAWSSSLRRGAPGSMNRNGWQFRGKGQRHDKFGWQAYAGDPNNAGSDWFYGFGHSRDHANVNRQPMYTTNSKFFLTLSFLTTILGIGQYARIREESKMVMGLTDRRHQDAAKSLNDARDFARSDAGRARYSEMRKRARELVEGEDEEVILWNATGGRGGISGREAYEKRLRKIGRSIDED